jgi:hypothetical protein
MVKDLNMSQRDQIAGVRVAGVATMTGEVDARVVPEDLSDSGWEAHA